MFFVFDLYCFGNYVNSYVGIESNEVFLLVVWFYIKCEILLINWYLVIYLYVVVIRIVNY